MSRPTSGQVVAWAGFLFGSVVSVAANVLHAWLPVEPPTAAAQIGAAVWPIALLLSVEAIARVRWRPGLGWILIRYGVLGIVGIGSFAISYGHLRDVLVAWHYTPLGAAVGPIVIDGLMVVSGFALLSEAQQKTASKESKASSPVKEAPVPAAKPQRPVVEEPEPQPSKVHNLNEPKPWSDRAKQLMASGKSRATAYRQAKKEFESVGA